MKAFVTGGDGQLGRMLEQTAPEGWDVARLDLPDLDITDVQAVQRRVATEAPDILFNAAAYTAVDRAETDEASAEAVNAAAVGHLATAARAAGARFVHVSTDFVFDGGASTAYAPDAPRAPLSAYGRTKAAGEDAAGPDALIVRTAWVYEAGGANFVNTMLRLMAQRDALNVVADQIGAPTRAKSLAETLWALALDRATGTFHFSDAGVASWYDFAVAIAEEGVAAGLLNNPATIAPIATADYPTPAHRPRFSLLDSSATRARTGLAPVHWRVNLRAMLRDQKNL